MKVAWSDEVIKLERADRRVVRLGGAQILFMAASGLFVLCGTFEIRGNQGRTTFPEYQSHR